MTTPTEICERLDAIRVRADRATPGPWAFESHGRDGDYGVGVLVDGDNNPVSGQQETGVMLVVEPVAVEVRNQLDAKFIANARDDVPFLLDLIEAQAAEIERLKRERDIAIGERIALSKLVRRLRNNFIDIRDELEDEGDRVYFGSTNDADEFREVVNELDSWGWHDLLRDEQQSDPFETSRKAIARAERAEAALEQMREVLDEALVTLKHARVFIGGREKMHPDGQALFDECINKIDVALQGGGE